MKAHCNMCGCHFPQDFKRTLEVPCNFWGDRGLGNLPADAKQEIWDWLFTMPADKINILFNLDFQVSFKATPLPKGVTFVEIVKNWNELTEEQKQDFQRNWFKERTLGMPIPPLPIHYEPR